MSLSTLSLRDLAEQWQKSRAAYQRVRNNPPGDLNGSPEALLAWAAHLTRLHAVFLRDTDAYMRAAGVDWKESD